MDKIKDSCLLHGSVIVAISTLLVASDIVMADCEFEQHKKAQALALQARTNADQIEKLVLIKKSLKTCPEYSVWLDLGQLEMSLDNDTGAVSAFEYARDSITLGDNGRIYSAEVRLSALANAWLAEASMRAGRLAWASVATQEAAQLYKLLNQAPPSRLVTLQALVDDAMVNAEASVLARSFEIQHQRATRGIGVEPVIHDVIETTESIAMAEKLEADFEGAMQTQQDETYAIPVAANNTVSEQNTTAIVTVEPAQSMSVSRLNIPVLFDLNSADISASSIKTIRQIGIALNSLRLQAPATVVVVGHTDAQGPTTHNQNLSQTRADMVLTAIRKIVQTSPIYQSVGRGETELRYKGNTEEHHRRNRRVEILVRR